MQKWLELFTVELVEVFRYIASKKEHEKNTLFFFRRLKLNIFSRALTGRYLIRFSKNYWLFV